MVAKAGEAGMCLYPGCPRVFLARGLCNSHYQIAAAMVRNGETTWDKLTEEGKARFTKTSKRRDRKVHDWFIPNE